MSRNVMSYCHCGHVAHAGAPRDPGNISAVLTVETSSAAWHLLSSGEWVESGWSSPQWDDRIAARAAVSRARRRWPRVADALRRRSRADRWRRSDGTSPWDCQP